jgi:hypothetical protein
MRSKYLIFWGAVIALVFYYLTCFRTFTWWDSAEYSLASLTLGVPHPPGSLLTVLIGWIAVIIPLGISKFFVLNLLAALMASAIVYFIGKAALGLIHENENGSPDTLTILAVAITALFVGLTHTNWYYAVRFTPYIMTALFTSLILSAIFLWLRKLETPQSHIYFGLILFLFGLDLSIHRSNLLMLPSILIWLALFKPRGYLSPKYCFWGIGSLIVGLAFQLINILLAKGTPFLNTNNPDNFSRFWDYISLKQYGGDWLINIYPRKAPFWSVQITDYWNDFAVNFFNDSMRPIGYLPLLLGIFGLVLIFRKNLRLGWSLLSMFVLSSLGAIVYFNLPANFFRSLDRHYMPSFVIFGLFAAYGAGALVKALINPIALNRRALLITVLALIILLPVQAVVRNYSLVDCSRIGFAYDYAKNLLSGLPENAIIYTQSDIDTFIPWCLQVGEKYRTDVTICNISLMNTPWFFEQILARDKGYPYRPDIKEIESSSIIPWKDTTFALNYLPQAKNAMGTIQFTLPPSIAGKYLLVSDQILYKTILANEFKRPICFSTMLPEQSIQWLMPYLRLDGLFYRLVPDSVERDSYAVLDKNLMGVYKFDGYADTNIIKEDPSRWVGWNYCSSFVMLASFKRNSVDSAGCVGTIARLKSVIHPEAINTPKEMLDAIENVCK